MLASDSGKPDRSRRVDEMTKELTPEYGSEKLQKILESKILIFCNEVDK